MLLLFAQLKGQEEITLRIGDPAPPLRYSKWLKGTPVESFKDDQLYILEFCATWCGPCKAAFPAIQKMVTYYKDNPDVQFVFIDTWERGKVTHEQWRSSLLITDTVFMYYWMIRALLSISLKSKEFPPSL